jgi:excisionase family DNA binding protein
MSETSRLCWTVDEAAERLGMPARTVQDLCSRKQLPAVKMANRWYLPVWGLEQWIARESGAPLPCSTSERANITSSQKLAKVQELRRVAADFARLVSELEE